MAKTKALTITKKQYEFTMNNMELTNEMVTKTVEMTLSNGDRTITYEVTVSFSIHFHKMVENKKLA